jgi:hypothetical protein
VDIIENVNSASTNQMTLHTDAGCTITNNGLSSGDILGTNCDVAATGNAGCSIATSNTASYGDGFNSANGGVYATEWTSSAISMWFFPRSAIPSDITSGSPDPSNWGMPMAEFSGGCDIDEHFMNQQIVFDTTFCGDWAGEVWSSDPVCSQKASTCVDYVTNNPQDFTDAYWAINSLKVYQENGAAASSTASASAISTVTSTSIVGTATVTPTTTSTSTSTYTFPTTFATSTSYTFSFGASSTISSFSNSFFTSTPTSFSNTFFTSTPTSFSNTFFTPSSTFSNTFFTPSSTFSNTFFTSTPTGTFTFPAAGSSWTSSWTQPTGTSSWSSWGGGQGGQGGGNGGGGHL